MNTALFLAIKLPIGLPHWLDWLGSGWWSMLLWTAWLFSFGLFGLGLAFFFSNAKGELVCPNWVLGLLVVTWFTTQVLAWRPGGASWSAVMFNGAIFALLVFLGGMLSQGIGRIGIVILAALLWFSWPTLSDYGGRLAAAVPPLCDKVTDFISGGEPEEPATVESARAELDRYLQKWRGQGIGWAGTPEGGNFFSDIHQGLGFVLASYSIGPGRKLDEGVFEFRVLMEVSKFTLSQFATYHPEKVITVIHFPKTHKVARARQREWAVVATGGMTTEEALTRALSESQDLLRDAQIHFRTADK